jgi:acyl-coenzyme A synthetase/AMP-(fatty) acid ligase
MRLGADLGSKLWGASGQSVITDGTGTIPRRDLFVAAGHLRRQLDAAGIDASTPIALVCESSIGTALALGVLLERRQCVVLQPAGDNAPPPVFCRRRITVVAASSRMDTFVPELVHVEWPRGDAVDDVAPRVYTRTSGSTAAAKLVVHEHELLVQNAENVARRIRLAPQDRVVIPVPLHHLYGLGAAFLPAMLSGASIDLQAGANLLKYFARERVFKPTVAFLTPSFALTLVNGRRGTREYRVTVMAGDKLPASTFERYTAQCGCVVQLYGSTEMGAMAAGNPEDPASVRTATVGAPLDGVEFRLDDNGQLLCRHPFGFESYADDTGRRIDRDAWFQTRDLALFDERGRVAIKGRCDSAVKRDGLLVSIPDIEASLLQLPDVERVAIISSGRSVRGVGLVAYCVLRPSAVCTETAFRDACFKILPTRAVPDVLRIVPALPMLESGKIDRQTLHVWAETAASTSAGEIGS